MTWGSTGLEVTFCSILCSLISSESSGGAAKPTSLVSAPGGISSPDALVGECHNCLSRQAACHQAPKGTDMKVHRSLGQVGEGCMAAGSYLLSAWATASPPLLENKPEMSEAKNELKGDFCLSRAPYCQGINICPKQSLQDQPSLVKLPYLGKKTSASASGVST